MAITKTPTTLLSNVTVSAGGSQTASSALDLSAAIDFAIGYTLTFNGSATGNARIDIFADPTAANSSFSVGTYDDPIDSFTIPVDAGRTVNGLVPMLKCAKYIKARLVNLDATYTITAAYLYGIVQTA